MLFTKWIFLKLFGRGEPDRVRHLKNKNISKKKKKEKRSMDQEFIKGACYILDEKSECEGRSVLPA